MLRQKKISSWFTEAFILNYENLKLNHLVFRIYTNSTGIIRSIPAFDGLVFVQRILASFQPMTGFISKNALHRQIGNKSNTSGLGPLGMAIGGIDCCIKRHIA